MARRMFVRLFVLEFLFAHLCVLLSLSKEQESGGIREAAVSGSGERNIERKGRRKIHNKND